MAVHPAPKRTFIRARFRGGYQKPKAIVIHGTVSSDDRGTARRIALWWMGPSSPKSSAHYVVDPVEDIQCVGDHTVAFHCGYNEGSIAIELCDEQTGPARRWNDADSVAILKRAARLAAELCLAYGISVKRPSILALKARGPHGIYGHDDSRRAFGRTTHTDPRDFPWKKFMGMVRAEVKKLKAERERDTEVFASLNAPSGKKKGLITSTARRAERVINVANRNKVTVLGLQESGSVLRARLTARPGWEVHFGGANSRWGSNLLGNAIAWRVDIWSVAWRGVRVVPFGDNELYLPVVILRHRATGRLVRVMCAHHPTRRADPLGVARAAVTLAVQTESRLAKQVNTDFVALGDGNGAFPLGALARSGVDYVAATLTRVRAFNVPAKGVSDHPHMVALEALLSK